MSKLFYNVYSNITDRQFFKIEKELLRWKYVMATILQPAGWRAGPVDEDKEGLGFEFLKKKGTINGGIGITFDDQPNRITFTLVVYQWFDENKFRYSIRFNVFEDKEADFFRAELAKFTDEALKIFNNWDKEYIIKFGDNDELN